MLHAIYNHLEREYFVIFVNDKKHETIYKDYNNYSTYFLIILSQFGNKSL